MVRDPAHNAFPDLLVASEEIDATEDADRFCAGLESANIYEIAPALKGTP